MVVLGGRQFLTSEVPLYRGTSLVRKRRLRSPYCRTMPSDLRFSLGGGVFL